MRMCVLFTMTFPCCSMKLIYNDLKKGSLLCFYHDFGCFPIAQ